MFVRFFRRNKKLQVIKRLREAPVLSLLWKYCTPSPWNFCTPFQWNFCAPFPWNFCTPFPWKFCTPFPWNIFTFGPGTLGFVEGS